jgi:hypothetical protein
MLGFITIPSALLDVGESGRRGVAALGTLTGAATEQPLLNPPFDEIHDAAGLYGGGNVEGLGRYAEAFNGDQTPVLAHISGRCFQ